MWLPVTFLLLAVGGSVTCTSNHEHAWETKNEYQYEVRSQTLVGLDKLNNEYKGILLRGNLTIQVKSSETLLANFSNPQYAHISATFLTGLNKAYLWDELEFHQVPMSGKPMIIKLKHGVIRNLMVDRYVPTWELNILKAVVSQLQIDTQGENAIKSKSDQIPNDKSSHAMFRAMEDSVGGKCEVLYDITQLPDDYVGNSIELPLPQLRGVDHHYEVKKIKNYEKCQQRQMYHYHLHDPLTSRRIEDKDFLQLSSTQMFISGHLKHFTIQSTLMESHISVKPAKSDPFLGTVHSMTSLILTKRNKISDFTLDSPELTNLESTGNLVYTYSNPFFNVDNRKVRPPSISRNSAQVESLERTSSSSQAQDDNESSSSKEYHKQDDSLLQPKLALYLAPNTPMLPYYVGYKGRSIQMSDKVDVVKHAENLISQIADELRTEFSYKQSTLEKYITLKNLVRTMSRNQYSELEDYVLRNKDEQDHYNDKWSIFRDVVTQAGTGPALLTIENWIKTKKIEGLEAARLVSKIPKKARLPNADYIRTLFEITNSRHVENQKYLNVSAPLALAELIRNNHAAQKYYPIHSFGRITLEETRDNEITNRYIPYFADQLKQGFRENNINKIHTYIFALGMTGHEKILSVFEPYLEGMKPTSKFHRLLMVASMSTLAKFQPKLVGPILFKLYSNLNEAQEIRALAVQQFIMTNPSEIGLQTIARFTNTDPSERVNSVVRTTLESVANMKRPELRHFAMKARNARYLLNPNKYNSWKNSRGFYQELEGIFKKLSLQYIVGDDGQPTYAHLSIGTLYDFLDLSSLEVGYAVSNYRQLRDQLKLLDLEESEENEELKQKLNVENIAQTLKIKPEHPNKLEGNIFIDTIFGLVFWSFDSKAIEKASSQLQDLLEKDHKLASTVFNNYEATMSFSTENGLPFIYTLDTPIVTKFKAEWNKNESPVIKRSGILSMYVANKVQKRFGFLAPFEHKHYIANIDDNRMLQSLPLEYEFEMDTRFLNLKIRPNLPQLNSPVKLMHRSTVPYIAQRDIFDFQPVTINSQNTRLVKKDTKTYKTKIERETYSVQVEADSKEIENEEDVELLVRKFRELQNRYKKLEILMNSEQLAKSELHINVTHDKKTVSALNDDKQLSHKVEPPTALPVKPWELSSENRRKNILKGLSVGLKSGMVHVHDMSFNFPKTLQKYRQLLTIGRVNSNIDRKSRIYLYWNFQTSKQERPEYEVCYYQRIQTSPNVPLDYEYMIKNAPNDRLKAELRYGESCETGTKVIIDTNMTRSNQLKEMLENSVIVKKCQEEIKKGNKTRENCQLATEIAEVRDQFNLLIQPSNDAPKNLRETINAFIDLFSYIYPEAHVKTETNAVTEIMMYRPSSNVMQNLLMRTPQMNEFTQLNVNLLRPLETQTMETMETQQQLKNVLLQNKDKSSCTLDKNRVTTFDKRLYPVALEACKHVLLTTYPQQDPNNLNNYRTIPKEMRITVLAEDADSNSKRITLLLGNQEVQLMKLDNDLKAKVNEKTIELPRLESYQHIQNDKTIFEIGNLPDQSIEVTSDKYGIRVVYDGERVQLLASDRYRNAIRGLCGNYDSKPNNDFLTPKNCIVTNPEEFAATYALTEEKNCRGLAIKNKKRAEKAECREIPSEQHRLTNVISDKEAGRTSTESKNWGYHHDNLKKEHGNRNLYFGNVREYSHEPENRLDSMSLVYRTKVFEQDEEICFTTRPVPTCPPNSRPAERKQKKYDFYCAPKNEETLAMKRLIEQGANPDLTRKPSSRSRVFDVPLSCNAA